MSRREWYSFGLGAAVQGALVSVLVHSLFLLLLNMFFVGTNIWALSTGTDE
jgi:hypothetical protein